MTKPLEGRVAVVAGATRGAGRGIASALGEAGATVYCTGRSIRGQPATEGRPETLEETAEKVTSLGGRGLWVRVDHTVVEEVAALFERIRRDEGRLDVLVNDVWGGDALTEWGKRFWELDLDKGFLMLERAVNAHIITSRFGVPLLLEGSTGLVVEVTDGASDYYRGNLFYDLAKATAIRLASDMAIDLKGTGVTAVAVTPGFLRSEAVLEHFGVAEENWHEAIDKDPYFEHSETPLLVGRAIAALASDPRVVERSGGAFSSCKLAKEYGFTDIDGRQPDFYANLCKVLTDTMLELLRRPTGSTIEQFRESMQAAFEAKELTILLTTRPERLYEDFFALGPAADRKTVSQLVDHIFALV